MALTLLAMLLVLGSSGLGDRPGAKDAASHPTPGISQYVESRDGRTSCWGVIIQLDRLTFDGDIPGSAIEITDSKYSRDMKPGMTWNVDPSRKRLIIAFKPGFGDFGSGNQVRVILDESAFRESGRIGKVIFTMTTDLL